MDKYEKLRSEAIKKLQYLKKIYNEAYNDNSSIYYDNLDEIYLSIQDLSNAIITSEIYYKSSKSRKKAIKILESALENSFFLI